MVNIVTRVHRQRPGCMPAPRAGHFAPPAAGGQALADEALDR